jgi:hypothetical protein
MNQHPFCAFAGMIMRSFVMWLSLVGEENKEMQHIAAAKFKQTYDMNKTLKRIIKRYNDQSNETLDQTWARFFRWGGVATPGWRGILSYGI